MDPAVKRMLERIQTIAPADDDLNNGGAGSEPATQPPASTATSTGGLQVEWGRLAGEAVTPAEEPGTDE